MITAADFYTLSNNENHLCLFPRALGLPLLIPHTVLIPQLELEAPELAPRTHQSNYRDRHFAGTQLPHRIYLSLFSPMSNCSSLF